MPCREVLQLTDSFRFPEESDVNVAATMININSDSGDEILDRCQMLREYAAFVAKVRQMIKAGHDREAAINMAVDHCLDQGILHDILVTHKSEVVEMMLTEYNEEQAMELFRRDGVEEGRLEGREESRLEDLRAIMMSLNFTAQQAMDALNVPPCEREKYERQLG